MGPTDAELREALLKFVADFADWDRSADQSFIAAARALIRAASAETPVVLDSFSGGGSIPLEAIRLGCEGFAVDVNPVACLLLKTLLEDIPQKGPELAREVRRVGQEIELAAAKQLEELFPPEPGHSRAIAYLWARTISCESPNCGAEIPLVRSLWLSERATRKRALRWTALRQPGAPPKVGFEVFEPKSEKDVQRGTVALAKATCVACGTTLGPDRVRAQLATQHGGADVVFNESGARVGGAMLLAVVTLKEGVTGRDYRAPAARDYGAVFRAQRRLGELLKTRLPNGAFPVPDEATPQDGSGSVGGGFRTRKYGVTSFGDFFTARQKIALATLASAVRELPQREAGGVRNPLALAVSRSADYNSANCRWVPHGEFIGNTYTRQALPIVWDFVETNLFGGATGGFAGAVEWVANVAEKAVPATPGQVHNADARDLPLPDESAHVWFTDPPYYDAVPYADLSDFFFVWLKRALPDSEILRDVFDSSNPLTPKRQEAVRDEQVHLDGRPKKSAEWYEQAMARAFAEARRVLRPEGIGCVVFAHKTTEGWESLLSGLTGSGWTITASWPIATEMGSRLRARESAALATSVHLVCRPRDPAAPVGDWADVARELPLKVRAWMQRLDEEGVRGADLVFACIGPAMEVYSRYSKVVDAEDRVIPLGGDPTNSEPHRQGYLAKVWEVVGRIALEQVLGKTGSAGSALEEDARLTALFLWALQSTNGSDNGATDPTPDEADAADEEDDQVRDSGKRKGFTLPFDVTRRFAQPLGIHLETWEGRIVETKKGIVRLLPVAERAERLFGAGGPSEASDDEETGRRLMQFSLTPDEVPAVPVAQSRAKGQKRKKVPVGDGEAAAQNLSRTTLDRIHAAMLLQGSGKTTALRALLSEEKRRGPDFERLANALAALYPRGSEERRLVEAMLLAMPK